LCALDIIENINSEIIVINDDKASNVNVPEHAKIKLFNNPKQGLASARNLGAKLANGELLLFVDDDIEFTLNNVKQLIDLYNKRPGACYNSNWKYSQAMSETVIKSQFGRFLIKYKLVNYKGWVPELNWQDDVFEVKKLAGFFMLMPKDIFDRLKGFNEEFLHQGTEDDELCMRLKHEGVKMFVDPNNYVYHNEIDRIGLEMRMARYYNGAINRKIAFDLGHTEYEIKYTPIKRLAYSFLWPTRKLIIFFANLIPNRVFLDFIYFKVAHLLLGIFIFGGYHSKK
jgi:GT2 family glycosyltransferase